MVFITYDKTRGKIKDQSSIHNTENRKDSLSDIPISDSVRRTHYRHQLTGRAHNIASRLFILYLHLVDS